MDKRELVQYQDFSVCISPNESLWISISPLLNANWFSIMNSPIANHLLVLVNPCIMSLYGP